VSPVPTYYGEGFANPNGYTGVFLAVEVDGMDVLPSMLNSLPIGADAQFNWLGSFLSLVQFGLPFVTDLSLLTAGDWLRYNGSYGVDFANSIAWSVNDIPNANYTVVARGLGTVPEPATLSLLGVGAVGLLVRRREFISRKPTHRA